MLNGGRVDPGTEVVIAPPALWTDRVRSSMRRDFQVATQVRGFAGAMWAVVGGVVLWRVEGRVTLRCRSSGEGERSLEKKRESGANAPALPTMCGREGGAAGEGGEEGEMDWREEVKERMRGSTQLLIGGIV
jgi:hypothetical protein